MRLSPLLLALLAALAAGSAPAQPPAPATADEVRVLPTGGLRAETAALLLSGQEGGLPLAVLALPLPEAGGEARVPVIVEAAGAALLAGHEEGPLRIEVCVYALGTGGGVLASLLDTVVIPPSALDRLERSGLKFAGEIRLPAGEASLRVLVRNPATKAVGLKRLTVSVPILREGSALLLPPLFPESGDAWVTARAAEGPSPIPPLPGGVALPAARPVLLPEAEVRFLAFAYHFPAEGRLAVELRRRDGEQKSELPVRLAPPAHAAGTAGAGDLAILTASFTPHDLPPGDYELRLVSPTPTGEIRSAALPVIVGSARSGEPVGVWTALSPAVLAGGPAGAAPAATAEAPRHRRFALSGLVAAFRQALQPLAAGDDAGAQAAVSAFETAHLVNDRPPLPPEDLAEVEGRVTHDLVRRDPEALVPVLLLFERLYHAALTRHAYLLSTHDGEVVLALTTLYVKQSQAAHAAHAADAANTAAVRELAAGVLVGLARGRMEGSVNSFCSRALRLALLYDEGNEAALLALGVDAGRRGNLRQEADLLEKLVRRHPESLEGRLRLGVTEARLGYAERARRRLEEIVAPPAASGSPGSPGKPEDSWLLSLAFQELARLERRAGHPERAAEVLAAGLSRLPGDGELLLEQAALLDRRGEHGRAREVVEAVQAQVDSGSTPRHRYDLPPDAAVERAWSAVEARAAERRPALAAALAEKGR